MLKMKNWLRKSLNKLKSKKQLWKEGLDSEVKYWDLYVQGKTKWSQDINQRLDDNYLFPKKLQKYINPESQKIKVLDVGAGPLSALGCYWLNGPKIELYPIDPLADEYDLVLSKAGIKPKVKTMFCEGEKITQKFSLNFFDFVYARNSLDHAYEPIKCFQEMFAVLKNNCYIYTIHYNNEGQRENYEGLHQWNFDIINSNFCIWNKKSQLFLKDYLSSEATISTHLYNNWIEVFIKKEKATNV
jgi:SAM-dependent methyltransferase